jgi:hypothetical protein
MKLIQNFRLRKLILSLLLAAVLAVGVAGPHSALAGRSGCRADPLVVLLDGSTVQIVSSIGTDINDVQHIEYTVHVPVGSRVVAIVYTDSILGIHEHLSVVADLSPGQYTTDTVVYTGVQNASVSTQSTLVRLVGLHIGKATGHSRQHLGVKLRG